MSCGGETYRCVAVDEMVRSGQTHNRVGRYVYGDIGGGGMGGLQHGGGGGLEG